METSNPESKGDDGRRDCAQSLSCLLDGELDGAQCAALLEQLRHDAQAQSRWVLLNCAGDALRSAEVGAWHRPGFVARVSDALEGEPTVLAPSAVSRPPRKWLLAAAGAAAAAAVLIVVVMPQRPTVDAPAALVKAPAALVTVPASAPIAPPGAATMQIDRLPELERYLAAHRELAAPALMPQATPYLRASTIQVQERR